MEQLDARQLLQSVTRLVEKPDIKALELSLIATLGKIIKATSIRLCQLHLDPTAPQRQLLVYADPYEAAPLEGAPAFRECLETERRVIVRKNARVIVIHPIKVRSGIVGFLVIECEKEDAHDQDIVSILLDFYKNYASLLLDTERDVLTGLLNRKSFYEKVLQLIGSHRNAPAVDGSGVCLAVIDIDKFTQVNDQYGHLVGDETLILLARTMVDVFRGGDLLFRMGGEEFVVVLKDIDIARASAVLERLRQVIEARGFPQVGRLTASVGASFLVADDLPMNLIDRAHKALYYAKANGRNQVCFYENLVSEGKLSALQKRQTDIELF
ncbi:MAG: GGDEF domain-containing protein [Sulfurifustis sp.]